MHHVPHGTLRYNGLIAESTLSDSAYPYWQKKDRKPKRWQQQLQVELQTLAASVLCLQNVDGDLFQVHLAQLSRVHLLTMKCMVVPASAKGSGIITAARTFAEHAEA